MNEEEEFPVINGKVQMTLAEKTVMVGYLIVARESCKDPDEKENVDDLLRVLERWELS